MTSARLGLMSQSRAETGATSRVYVHEWILEHRARTAEAAQEWLNAKYAGRLRDGDSKVTTDVEGPVTTYEVWVRLWNPAAEWKHAWQAEKWAVFLRAQRPELSLEDIQVVGRNSRTEHKLRAYGKLLLPAA